MRGAILLFCFLLPWLCSFPSYVSAGSGALVSGEDDKVDTIAIDEAIALVRDKYLHDIPMERMLDGALLGLMHSVDQYSDYLSPVDFKEFQSSIAGTVHGIGIEFGRKEGLFVIFSVAPSSPASRVGLLPGDTILSVDGVPCEHMSIAAVTNAIRGTSGAVEIKVGRRHSDGNSEVLKFNPKRSKIVVNPVRSLISSDIIIVKMLSFSKGSYDALLLQIKRLLRQSQKPIAGLVIDLRDNPGGLLEEAVDIAGLFLLADSPIVTVRTKDDKGIADFVAGSAKDPIDGKPIVILINEYTSSAAEILAAALQENNRAVVLGARSYGKGSVQDIFPLLSLPGAALKITFAAYQTPLGYYMEGRGVRPDVAFDAKDVLHIPGAVLEEENITKEAMRIIGSAGEYNRLLETANHPHAGYDAKRDRNEGVGVHSLRTSFLMSHNMGIAPVGLVRGSYSFSETNFCCKHRLVATA